MHLSFLCPFQKSSLTRLFWYNTDMCRIHLTNYGVCRIHLCIQQIASNVDWICYVFVFIKVQVCPFSAELIFLTLASHMSCTLSKNVLIFILFKFLSFWMLHSVFNFLCTKKLFFVFALQYMMLNLICSFQLYYINFYRLRNTC